VLLLLLLVLLLLLLLLRSWPKWVLPACEDSHHKQ
jgi:hypothetical protein